MDACIEDFDLGLVARRVTQEVEQIVEKVTLKKNSLQNVFGRIARLHGTLLDQGHHTMRALRSAYLAKARLCEAERAIRRAQGRSWQCPAVEHHTAKQERDAARGVAMELKLRVEILNSFHGDGSGTVLKATYSRLEDSLGLLSSDLAHLREWHRALLAKMTTLGKAVTPGKDYDPAEKRQLEARWIFMSSSLDKMMSREPISCVTWDQQVLLTETQERVDLLRRGCSEMAQMRSLINQIGKGEDKKGHKINQ